MPNHISDASSTTSLPPPTPYSVSYLDGQVLHVPLFMLRRIVEIAAAIRYSQYSDNYARELEKLIETLQKKHTV